MVQIGNLHIGKADTATQPQIDIGEAFILTQQLYYRYICILRNALMILNNDSLRVMFIDFVKEEMDIMMNCCKFGKLKGWLPNYPIYKPEC